MKQYQVRKTIPLNIMTPQEHFDTEVVPPAILESDGSTIWVIKGAFRHQSASQAGVIDEFLASGRIEEIQNI